MSPQRRMSLSPGERLGPYEILSTLGAGGMGEVYRARHLKLDREVALKVLPDELADDRQRRSRLEREARAASSLNHPNIVAIYDIAEAGARTYIAMELVAGSTLRQLLADGPLPIEAVLDLFVQIADALARAHEQRIVHRDLKPENVMVTPEGRVKILDFGLAKPLDGMAEGAADAPTVTRLTLEGGAVGTPDYMSPEQASGGIVDARSDQFAFGILLYEVLAGRRPFAGETRSAAVNALLHAPPAPLDKLRPDAPAALLRIVLRCLEKQPARRFPSSRELEERLTIVRERRARRVRRRLVLRRPPVLSALLAGLFIVAVAIVLWARGADARWMERVALPGIADRIDRGELWAAFRLALEVEQRRPGHPEVAKLLGRFTLPFLVRTEPADAEVSVQGYASPDEPWQRLGATPLSTRVPYALMRWRIVKPGFETFDGAPFSSQALGALARGLVLDRVGERPHGSVRVAGGPFTANVLRLELPAAASPLLLPDYWIDRFEVTNGEFLDFVEAGGYRAGELWRGVLESGGDPGDWEATVDAFRDTTGRPGPATWELGRFPVGAESHPVGGISWHEAAAYCRWAGKSLPTIFHWFHAVGQEQRSEILGASNFGGEGPAPVGSFRGLAAFGTYDQAGNVKEWSWNATSSGRRYVLGGAWDDPAYFLFHLVARQPLEREASHGVRCASYSEPPAAALLGAVDPAHEISVPDPVEDDVFAAYLAMYDAPSGDLEVRVEAVDASSSLWRKETVSVRSAYGDERMRIYLLLPPDSGPPYSVVLWFPGGDAFVPRSSETLASSFLFDFLPRSGRAVAYPVYQGSYERFVKRPTTPLERRERMIQWSQDLGRALEYLDTREDLDGARLAYYGFSTGAVHGPAFTRIHPRFSASILLGAGLTPEPLRPEMHPVHFAPRSPVPTLMISGFDDFILPYELAQKPFFDLLGAPDADKKLARLEGGHIPRDRKAMIRETLDWLERYLGPP